MSQHFDLFDPIAAAKYIADAKTLKGTEASPQTKNKMVFCYFQFCETNNIPYDKPYFTPEENVPMIPTTENAQKIISAATTRYAVIFTILAETGAEGAELETTGQKEIDKEQGIIIIKGHKGHGTASYKLRQQTAEMLRIYLHKHPEQYPFPQAKIMGQVWMETRKRAAAKLCQPQLREIPLKSLRNYSGAKLYYATHDPIAVMRHLRHKKLETTMHYLRGIVTDGEEEFTCKAACNAKEAMQLIEIGFQYVTTIDGLQLFRKRK